VNLLDSLLDAIVRLDGDALVMHVGEKPYVVTTSEATNQFRGPLAWGQVELSTRVLTTDAVSGMLGQILPLDQRSALDEYGATEYEVTATNHAEERFTIVAARGGDDIWVEMRRKPKVEAAPVAVAAPAHVAAVAASAAVEQSPVAAIADVGTHADSVQPEADEAEFEHASAAPPAALRALDVDAVAAAVGDEPLTIEEPLTMAALTPPSPAGEAPQHVAELPIPVLPIHQPEESFDRAETIPSFEATPPAAEETAIDMDVEPEFDAQPFSLESDLDAEILAATQDWGDDLMTEGELGELLRATAAAVITGEAAGDAEQGEEVSLFDEEISLEPETVEPDQEVVLSTSPAEIAHTAVVEEAPFAIAAPVEDQAVDETATSFAAAAEETPFARETRELPALVEYQIERDREANRAAQLAGDLEQVPLAAEDSADTELTHLIETTEHSVESAEEPSPVSEEAVPEIAVADMPPAVTAQVPDAALAAEEPALTASSEDAVATVVDLRATDSMGQVDELPPARPAAVVLPLTRQPKVEGTETRASVATTLQRLLRLAAARGAATVYVVAQTPPLVRVDGEFSTIEGEPALSAAFVERLLADVTPAARGSSPASAEWLIDVPEIGRVRCVTFRDHRGPGIIFRMVPPRAISADQLGLSAEVQALCSEADGLVLVAGSRGSGKSTLLTSFVDLINRTRSDHIITTEPQIEFVHESKRSFISQREVRGEDAMVAAVRAASREEPDVLVIEDIRTHELAGLALDAAESGRLVFASVPGLSTTSALEQMIELFPAERREKVQGALAGTLRGMVSQVLLRKLRGGRIAAREVLINTPQIASLIMEGKTFQLPAALENGRRSGMTSFADSLAGLVREGTVHPSHAYRKAPNREQFLAALRRDGIDTSVAERVG
jgi:twitching motility protein PilT